MGLITINTKYGPIDVKIKGDKPTSEEFFKLDDIEAQPEKYVPKEIIDAYRKSLKGEDQTFDYATGIQDGKLRRMLGRADTRGDEEKVLKEAFGLLETEFTRDNRGRLALTPEGAQKFGIETNKNVIIDEKGFTRQDFSDLTGVGTTVAGGVAGAVAGTLVGGPIGGIIGAGLGGAGGKSVEEATEALQGVQAQEGKEITKDIAVEGLIAAAGEGIFAGLGKAFRVVSGTGGVGKGLPDDRVKDILAAEKKGYLPSLGAIGAPSLIARQQAISEKALGTSARLRKNHENIMKDLEWLKNEAGQVDLDGAAQVLTSASKTGNNKLKTIVKDQEVRLLKHMEEIADNLGRASQRDSAITDDLFKSFQESYKAFDDLVETKFLNINNALEDSVGDSAIFKTRGIADDAARAAQKFENAVPGTNPARAGAILKTISELGDKASFGQLYYARKSLRDAGMFNITSDTIGNVVDDFLPQIDNLLDLAAKGRNNFLNRALPGAENQASRKLLREAARDLSKARNFYREGNQRFEKVSAAINKKALIDVVRNDTPANAQEMMRSLIRKNNPQLLKDAKEVVDEFAGAGTFDPLKQRLASSWIRSTLQKSENSSTGKFSGYKFKDELDKLGSTADELFGDGIGEIRKFAEQLSALSLRNVDQSVIDDFVKAGADDSGINLLKKLSTAQDDLATFNQNNIAKKLRSGNITPTEAAELISSNSMRAEDIASLRRFFDDDADAIGKIRAYYMDNLIGDFQSNFLTDRTQFAKFGERLTKNKAKIEVIYGKEMAKEMDEFGRIMKLLGESANGGDLVAANIAASPLENLGTIARLSIVGQLFSSPRFYKAFTRKYKRLSEGQDASSRGQIAGELLSDAVSSLIAQGTAQSIDQAVGETAKQVSSVMQNAQRQTKTTPPPTPVPQVLPPIETGSINKTPNIRQRAKENPAIASTLLGGLGSADLL
jgi:hypothetical protein